MKYIKIFLVILFFVFNKNSLHAQGDKMNSTMPSFNTDYMKEIDAAQDKILALAEAFPQDKFSWRPMEGVRSPSEVFMHVASANFYLLSFMGADLPKDLTRGIEKEVTKKEEVIKWVKSSYENLKSFMSKFDPKTLDDPLEYFGTKGDKRHLLFILLDHNHEHLGQAIAYARMNKIVPPWSK